MAVRALARARCFQMASPSPSFCHYHYTQLWLQKFVFLWVSPLGWQ
jgi:hypothetical protein